MGWSGAPPARVGGMLGGIDEGGAPWALPWERGAKEGGWVVEGCGAGVLVDRRCGGKEGGTSCGVGAAGRAAGSSWGATGFFPGSDPLG